MSSPTPAGELATRLRTMQIIFAALVAGASAFLIVASVQRPAPPEAQAATNFYTVLGLAAVLAVGYHFVVYYVEAAQRRRLAQSPTADQAAWYGAYQITMIAGLGVLEAGAFLILILYWIDPDWRARLAAVGCIAMMLTYFPTVGGIERWIKEQQDRLRQDRSGS